MNRELTMCLWMFYRPAMLGVMAVVFSGTFRRLEDSGVLSSLGQIGTMGAGLLFAWAAIWIVYGMFRLWRWEQGNEPTCDCGGLLSGVIAGRWGPYRKCFACRRNVAEK